MKKNDRIVHAYKGTEPYLFISYAHQDEEKVLPVIEWLNVNGYRVWYDEGLETSNDFKDEISINILNCSCFMVFLSNNSTKVIPKQKISIFCGIRLVMSSAKSSGGA